MRKKYMRPAIVVVRESYNEGLMQSWSTGIGTGGGTPPPPAGSRPGDTWEEAFKDESWGDTWTDHSTN